MVDRREKNAKIFQDTEYMYENHEALKNVVSASIGGQKLILSNEKLIVEPKAEWNKNVVVSGKRTLEASENYAKKGKKVCVLNFASATNPGGGVVNGSSAQEEAICRCSTLYPCLKTNKMWHEFYKPHRSANNPLYNDDIIFTPGVKVFKNDTNFPELMKEADWWDVDVITCAAPNIRRLEGEGGKITNTDLEALLRQRIERVFQVAIKNGAEVLILGAFGCGAFRNPPKLVAKAFAEWTKKYGAYFDTIEYAVFHTEREKENFEAFKGIFETK